MSGLSADSILAAAAIWVAIMLPSAAFGGDPASAGSVARQCDALGTTPVAVTDLSAGPARPS
ncbi:hypothetical protein [Kaistia sp. 32K]|uniref:hypothetical protein n=1 Tax=Kaistia sp. 32K TaxID=2795690 RepID=UPI0019163B9C|nr:hypothetical protein [Kaistia sp. 32K]